MNIVTVGTGWIVEEFIESAKTVDGVLIVGNYSRDIERAKEFSLKVGAEKVYDSFEDVVNDEDVDTVYIATPNAIHYKQAKYFLENGKNVIIEKTIVAELDHAKELYEIAKENNLMLFEAISNIHMPNFKVIKESLKDLGDVRIVTSNFSKPSSQFENYKAGRQANKFDPKLAAGALMDVTMYNIQLIYNLFGMPKDAEYYANIENGIDTSGVVVMDYGNFKALAIGGMDSNATAYFEIQAENGYIRSNSLPNEISNLELNLNDEVTLINKNENLRMSYEISVFNELLNTKNYDQTYKNFEDSLNVLEIIQTVLHKSGLVFKDVI